MTNRIDEVMPLERSEYGTLSMPEDIVARLEEHYSWAELTDWSLRAAPFVTSGHEDEAVDRIVAVALVAGIFTGWEMRSRLD